MSYGQTYTAMAIANMIQEAIMGPLDVPAAAALHIAAAPARAHTRARTQKPRQCNKRTPLHEAVIADDGPRIAKLLADRTANPANAMDVHHMTPLHYAKSAMAVAQLVVAGAAVNATDTKGRTPLMTARNPAVVRALGANGAAPDVGSSSPDGRGNETRGSPVLVAVRADADDDLLNALLSVPGATPHRHQYSYRGRYGGTGSPLACARSARVVKLLLAHGADPNDKGRPLNSELAQNDVEVTRLLLDAGADPNVGMSLHSACNADVAQLLLDRGADPTVTCNGRAAKEIAKYKGYPKVAAVIKRHLTKRSEGGPAAKKIKKAKEEEERPSVPAAAVAVAAPRPAGEVGCVVCMDAKPSVMLMPCHHVCVCTACHSKMAVAAGSYACPMCRREVLDSVHCYLP